MKSLLLLLLIGAVSVLAFQNYQKGQSLARIQEAAQQEEEASRLKKISDERTQYLRERDEARRQLVNANNEIARLTHTTPKPVSWIEKRVEESSAKLDGPVKPTPAPPQ